MTATADRPTATAPLTGTSRGGAVAARSAVALDAAGDPMTLAELPDRDLDPAELVRLAASIGRDSTLWAEHVAFSDGQRHYVSLYRDAHVDVWVLCWTPANDTGWHDHDISSGAVAVVRGRLVEHNLAIGSAGVTTEVAAGRAFGFGPEHIHRLTGLDQGSVSIHAYSPPLWRMGQYAISSDGVLRRTSVSYASELRPLDDAV